MRVDTVGYKTLKIGYGHLEFVGRLSFEGFKANDDLPGIQDRESPILLGLGSFQKFDWGGVFVNAFVNASANHGYLAEAIYAGKFNTGPITFYPTAGVEYRSGKYVSHLYGVNATEALTSGRPAYTPDGFSLIPVLGLAAEFPISGNWGMNLQLRQRWLDGAIKNSPLVDKSTQTTGYAALVYRFK